MCISGRQFFNYALYCHLVYLTIPGKRLLSMIKQKVFVVFITRFTSVQINMNQVSYLCVG